MSVVAPSLRLRCLRRASLHNRAVPGNDPDARSTFRGCENAGSAAQRLGCAISAADLSLLGRAATDFAQQAGGFLMCVTTSLVTDAACAGAQLQSRGSGAARGGAQADMSALAGLPTNSDTGRGSAPLS